MKHDPVGFQQAISRLLSRGARQTDVAAWAGVSPSTVHRWLHGHAQPSNPVAVLNQLRRHAEQLLGEATPAELKAIRSWREITPELNPMIGEYAELSGLLCGAYFVVSSWIPSPHEVDAYDVVVLRYFDDVWADMSRRVYNIGDGVQLVSRSEDEHLRFDQSEVLGDNLDVTLASTHRRWTGGATFHLKLNLARISASPDSITSIGGFGHRYRCTQALARWHRETATTDALAVTAPVPCKRLRWIMCLPRRHLRGAPRALSVSNGRCLDALLELDNADYDTIESLLWPRGIMYELSSSPESPLQQLIDVQSVIHRLPDELETALAQRSDLGRDGDSVQEILCSSDSVCFFLDLRFPHPSLTQIIVWHLPSQPDR